MLTILRTSLAVLLSAYFASGSLMACGSSSDAPTMSAGAGGYGSSGSAGVAGHAQAMAGSSSATGGNSGAGGAVSGGSANGSAGNGSSSGSAGRNGSAGSAGSTGSAAGAGASAGAGNGAGSTGFAPWPGGNQVVTVDPVNTYASDLSGLHYEPAQGAAEAVLWAVQNQPSKLYRLLWNGSAWVSDTNNGWGSGKALHFPDGQGAPDSEGVTKGVLGSSGLYVSCERDNQVSATSRLSVLLFDGAASGATLTATREWNLTAVLPKVGANLGLEAIAWVPDSYLVDKGFIDESKQLAYDPASYGDHGDGVFFVGVEQDGMIHGFVLDHTSGAFTRVASFESGHSGVMDLSFDRDVGYLWAVCDDTCQGRTNVLDIDTHAGSLTHGRFYVRRGFERPSTMANLNNEGFTLTSESTCQSGFKSVFYAEDGSTMGFAIRRDSIPCGPFLGN
ncbi:MAG TPA: hypothetical protein VFK05_00335 [Polyangiaceae bacterium]|nr:hypothetical protein [Polyangiaceae bacterium]